MRIISTGTVCTYARYSCLCLPCPCKQVDYIQRRGYKKKWVSIVVTCTVLYCSVDKIGHYSAEINFEIYINHNGKFTCNGM